MEEKANDLVDYVLDEYNKVKNLDYRFYDEKKDDRNRNVYQRDYSRILYSSSFRRLQGKMQLLDVSGAKFYRNRLTHSLEVDQISRGIAESLRDKCKELKNQDIYINDIYVVEACALAHDIGNPPFGHHGERILNGLSKEFGGFEGNAQSLRVLMDLEKKLPNSKGLNITLRTLLGIIKYYNKSENCKNGKFLYEDNYNTINEILSDKFKEVSPRTLDVQIIDLADEIAYAAHDLEDALSLKLFTIDEYVYEFKHYTQINNKYSEAFTKFEEIVKKAKNFAAEASNYNSSEEYGLLLRKEITSIIVNVLINDIDLVEVSEDQKKKTGTTKKYELGFKNLGHLANGLKDFTFKSINRTNKVQLYERQGQKIINGLFQVYSDKDFNKNNVLLPVEFRPDDEDNEMLRKRLIIDYISGMMDTFAIETYKTYFGEASLNVIYNKKLHVEPDIKYK